MNTDFYLPRGVVIKKEPDRIVMENPGIIRIGKNQMLKGGISDPRNKTLMKMFNMIGIGERAGSGVPDIYSVWENQGWITPEVIEEYSPDRTILKLSFIRNELKKVTEKTQKQKELILSKMQPDMEYKVAEVAEWLVIGRTRTLLKMLVADGKILETGTTKMKRYQMVK